MFLWAAPVLAASEEEPTAVAGESRARELFERGSALYNEGNYEAALLSFREAQAIFPLPRMHFNIANCYERIGRIEDAIVAFEAYREVVEPSEHATLDRKILVLKARVADNAPVVPLAPRPAASVVAPVAIRTRKVPRWGLVGLGTGLAVGGAGFAGLASSLSDKESRRTITFAGVSAVVAGASLAGVGFALRSERQLVVSLELGRPTVSGRF